MVHCLIIFQHIFLSFCVFRILVEMGAIISLTELLSYSFLGFYLSLITFLIKNEGERIELRDMEGDLGDEWSDELVMTLR